MSKISCVIVEDELVARDVLKNYLAKYCPQIELIGEAKNAVEAKELILSLKPQLVFLDVELPFGNAFDILEETKEHTFETIFVTAFSEYSLKALNLSAAYYILKPVSIEELILAVNKVVNTISTNNEINRNKIILQNFNESVPEKKQIILPTLEGFEVVKIEDILRLKGNGNFTDLYLINGQKKMVCRFLKHFENLLPFPFIRVHKSHIINTNFVKAYHKSGHIILTDDSEVELSQSYKEAFIQVFKMN